MALLMPSRLRLRNIAELWSREIHPPRSSDELLAALLSAYWAGAFDGHVTRLGSPYDRREMLEGLSRCRGMIDKPLIIAPGEPAPPIATDHLDGTRSFDFRPRIFLDRELGDWTDQQFAAAALVLQERAAAVVSCGTGSPLADYDERVWPVINLIEISRAAFDRWLRSSGDPMPQFWRRHGEESGTAALSPADMMPEHGGAFIGAVLDTPAPGVKRRGRPKGCGGSLGDHELVAEGLTLLRERKAKSAHHAATMLADRAEGASYDAKVDRLGRKIRRQEKSISP